MKCTDSNNAPMRMNILTSFVVRLQEQQSCQCVVGSFQQFCIVEYNEKFNRH